MKRTKFIVAFLVMIIAAGSAEAQTESSYQRKRVKQGVRSGELTKAETINLAHQQKEIREDMRDAKADGAVTKGERKEIKKDKHHANRSIARKKHNGRDRN